MVAAKLVYLLRQEGKHSPNLTKRAMKFIPELGSRLDPKANLSRLE
jgi:hypothetical protein